LYYWWLDFQGEQDTPLHAKIGQQALELDFLARALTKAGWLGAKL
jgi:hypothetical protein